MLHETAHVSVFHISWGHHWVLFHPTGLWPVSRYPNYLGIRCILISSRASLFYCSSSTTPQNCLGYFGPLKLHISLQDQLFQAPWEILLGFWGGIVLDFCHNLERIDIFMLLNLLMYEYDKYWFIQGFIL